jgi:hypothetical protein
MLKGNIAASEGEKGFLESLGVIVGQYDKNEFGFKECLVSGNVLLVFASVR